MNGGQIAALVIAIFLLLPGGCFLFFGIGIPGAWPLLFIAGVILAVCGVLFWVAFSRKVARGRPPNAPPS